MAPSAPITANNSSAEECEEQLLLQLPSLPKERGWRSTHIYLYQGFWCPPRQLLAVRAFQQYFIAKDSDIILVTKPKSGTTWLKALSFSIVNRNCYSPVSPHHPLLTSNPHDLVPFFEYKLYDNQLPDHFPSPSLYASHVQFDSLPVSIKSSKCKLVYLFRNPADSFISLWHFFVSSKKETANPLSLQEAFDSFCKGVTAFGPYWNHVLGYWKQSLENPHKVLFFRYEDLKKDITSELKKLAEFLECPFSLEEESEGVIEKISTLRSFDNIDYKQFGGEQERELHFQL